MSERPFLKGFVLFILFGFVFFAVIYWLTRFSEGGGPATGERIAVVRVEGVILDATDTLDELKKYKENASVKAILIRINSPGGAVVPSQEIYEEIQKIRKETGKKIVISMGTLAASGGYYIASASDRIVANPGTLTGSIGVIMELMNVEGLFKKVGVESVVIKSGLRKDVGSPFRTMTKEERDYLQFVMDDVHRQFIDAVATGRGMKIDEVRLLADGRVFTGRQALENKLVDELGDFEDAVHVAGKMVGIKGEPKIIETKKRFSFSDLLKSEFLGTTRLMNLSPKGMPGLNYLWMPG
ncbi:MAG: signal peptide peptidase SppA [Nitrospirae bacterium]|nr:signal peptide peptidase SppA [Nitrospirota bacterium]MBI3593404.1 signal peptide peptidase SppA [Nitrospirota bacterium]